MDNFFKPIIVQWTIFFKPIIVKRRSKSDLNQYEENFRGKSYEVMRRSWKLSCYFAFNLLNLSTWIFWNWIEILFYLVFVFMTQEINTQKYVKHSFSFTIQIPIFYWKIFYFETKLWFLYGVHISYNRISYKVAFFWEPIASVIGGLAVQTFNSECNT